MCPMKVRKVDRQWPHSQKCKLKRVSSFRQYLIAISKGVVGHVLQYAYLINSTKDPLPSFIASALERICQIIQLI